MTEVLARGSHDEGTHNEPLRVRGPAYAVMTECLRIQATARKQSRLARLFGRDPIRPDARSWYRGALAEIRVTRMLGLLPAGWTVLHDTGDSGADQILIGPAGVFTVSTKNHSAQRVWVGEDSLLVNGHRTNHIRDARWEAATVSRLLGAGEDGPVVPIIALVDPAALKIDRKHSRDVVVLESRRLVRYLARRKRTVSDAAVGALVQRAERNGTWHAARDVVDDTLRHEARFARLTAEVDGAARRRAAWILLGALAVLLAIVVPLVLALG